MRFGRHVFSSSWAGAWVCILVLAGLAAPAHADDFLAVDQAFALSAERSDAQHLTLHWTIAPGHTLYKRELHLSLDGHSIEPTLPAAERKRDSSIGESVEVYHHRLDLVVEAPAQASRLLVQYQGCADAGLCYPPQQREAALAGVGPLAFSEAGKTEDPAPAVSASLAASSDGDAAGQGIEAALHRGNVFEVLGVFLFAGLLLSLTPCVLPMVPILSSIIVGQHAPTRSRSFQLALAYSMGMALVYTALGLAAGLAGEGMAAFLQQPAVLIAFALLLALLSLSMFDVYTLQVPAALQTRLSGLSGRMGGGAIGGAWAMGAFSALMVGPCVAAPLVGALLYIGQSHDVLLGGLALFALACGMSVPLLLTGLSAGSLLPRAGAWMNRVKHVFGVLLLAVAWSMVSPLLGSGPKLAGWGLLALAGAIFMGLHEVMPTHAGAGQRAWRALVMALAIVGGLELVGSATGANDPLAPLSRLARMNRGAGSSEAPQFARVDTLGELDRLLAEAGQPVLLDFYADWCTSCKEMERETFTDPEVLHKLAAFKLLRADVTANSQAQRELQKRFGLFGPPGLVFFDPKGHEQSAWRVIGYMTPDVFLGHLDQVVAQLGRWR